jgi:serine/threonine protein kinase
MASKEPKVFISAFDAYTVIRPVGSGGSGTVFGIKDSDGLHLALKLLNSSKAPKSKLKRFRNEIQLFVFSTYESKREHFLATVPG